MADSKLITVNPVARGAISRLRPSRELAVSRSVLVSFQTNHVAKSFSCLLDERSMSSGGSMQAVRRSSFAVLHKHDSAVLGSRSAQVSANTLLVRAWRSLIELRIDDALARLAQRWPSSKDVIGQAGRVPR
jgi:hypothetical protein